MTISPDRAGEGDLPLVFGRYTLLRLIGEGGMGRVFEARLEGPSGFRKTVALKVIRVDVAEQSPHIREAIIKEARVGGLLRHPNVVDVYDFGIHDGHPWVAMELVTGEGLERRIAREAPLETTQALRIAIDVARGLQHVHELQVDGRPAGLVHRDLKPANVLLGQHGEVKISDFGLARAAEGEGITSTGTQSIRGTPAYMAPEQAKGEPLDGRSDLFALGAMLFEMLAGERLLRGRSVIELMMGLLRLEDRVDELQQRFAHVPALPELVAGCLRANPAERHANAAAFINAARSILGSLEWSATEESASITGGGTNGVMTVDIGAGEELPAKPSGHILDDPASFVGRADDLQALARMLDDAARLISIVGPGGTGKTRLARRFAASQGASLEGGAWFIDLSEATSVDGICAAAARGLGIQLPAGGVVERLGAAIAGRGRCLVVLDNFEQVRDHAPATLAAWLERCPEAVFAVTSRQVLRLSDERAHRLGPLETPSLDAGPLAAEALQALAANDAVALFLQRARAVRPGFALTVANGRDVARLVAELDGIPLAIELAAARVRVLSPSKILDRLPQRFDLLTTGWQDATQRQATLRATIDWSWELLEPAEQAALAACSVFRGGFDLEAAEAVIDVDGWSGDPWVVDIVQALQDKSLLRVYEPAETPGDLRFDTYLSIREYAAEKLADGGAVRREDGTPATGLEAAAAIEKRHAAWYARAGSPVELRALGGRLGVRRRRLLTLELENLVAAVRRATAAGMADEAVGAALAAAALLSHSGPLDALVRLLDGVESSADLSDEARLRLGIEHVDALRATGDVERCDALAARLITLAERLGDPHSGAKVRTVRARTHMGDLRGFDATGELEAAREAFVAVGDVAGEGMVIGLLGTLRSMEDDFIKARTLLERALVLLKQVGNSSFEVLVLINLGITYKELGLSSLERATLHEALRLAEEMGFIRGEEVALMNLGVGAQEHGELLEAEQLFQRSIDLNRRVGNDFWLGRSLGNLGDVQRALGRLDEAEQHLREGLRLVRAQGDTRHECGQLTELAQLLLAADRTEEAHAAASESLSQARELGLPRLTAHALEILAEVELVRGDLEAARPFAQEALIRARELEEKRHEGLAQAVMGRVLAGFGELDAAREAFDAAERLLRGARDLFSLGRALAWWAEVWTDDRAEANQRLAEAREFASSLGVGPNSDLTTAIVRAERRLAEAPTTRSGPRSS